MSTYVHHFSVVARNCKDCYFPVQASEIRSLNLLAYLMTNFFLAFFDYFTIIFRLNTGYRIKLAAKIR
jgi:hypothetical protein